MSNKMKTTLLAGTAAMLLASCASSEKANKVKGDTAVAKVDNLKDVDSGYLIVSDAQREAINKTNTFAFNLFRTQTGMDSKVVSPASVAYLMGMLANGANGDTRQQILKALCMDGESLQTVNEAYRILLNKASSDKQTTISIANCIAVNRQSAVKPEYAKQMESLYDADVENLDFASQKAVAAINDWCKRHTDGMIPKMIDHLDAGNVAVLMNAIYFNGTWQHTFDKGLTKLDRFQGYTRDIKRVQMMWQNEKFRYAEKADYAAVNLPYGDGNYSMTVILPNADKSVSDIANALDAKKFAELRKSMEDCIVDLKLPRFTTSSDIQLNEPVSKLGAPVIFQPGRADFSNIANSAVYLSSMFQKAKIDVSEEGTKAAAVTMGMVSMTALNPEEPRHVNFHANRPFIYVITENTTGAVFFIGQYTGSDI